MLSRALKMTFWVTYDHLGKLILANLLWALAIAIPGSIALSAAMMNADWTSRLLLGGPFLFLTLGIVAPVMSCGLAYMAKILIDTRDGSLRDFFVGIRRFWKQAIALGTLLTVGACCLITSVWFYAEKLQDQVPWLGYAISALAGWCLLLLLLVTLLVIPALVQKKAGVLGTLQLSALLVLDNPFFVTGLALQTLVVSAFLIIPVLFFFIYGAVVLVLLTSAYEMLARRYAAIELAKAGGATGKEIGPKGAKQVIIEDAQDDYLNRGFRDFLFPWKG